MKDKKNNIDKLKETLIKPDVSTNIINPDCDFVISKNNSDYVQKRSNYISVMDIHRPPKEKPSKD